MRKIEIELQAADKTRLGLFKIPRKSKPKVIMYQGKAYTPAGWDMYKTETSDAGVTSYFRTVYREVEMYKVE